MLESGETISPVLWAPGTATEPQSTDSRLSRILKIDGEIAGIPYRGFHTITKTERFRVWAVGSFKFYRPEFDFRNDDGNLIRLRQLMTLYGFRINPATLYKITPWTWAVDWFTRFGDHLQRLNEYVEDGLVSRYLYVMRTTEKFVTKTSVMNAWSGSQTFQWQRSLEMKQRKAADSPYGFDRPWQSLSARQYAILGAVGITRQSSGFISRG